MKTNKNDPKSVGLRIKNIRQIIGDTMEQFAKKIDDKAKSGTVSNWETGKNMPNNKRLARIADLGGVTVEYLLEGKSFTKEFSTIPQEEKKEYLRKIKNSQKYNVLQELTKYNKLEDFSNQEASLLDIFFRFLNSSLGRNNFEAIANLSIVLSILNSLNNTILDNNDNSKQEELNMQKKLYEMANESLYYSVTKSLTDKIDE